MSQESITDASKPNAGRVYDYILGGSHNFEVDRQAADMLRKNAPFVMKAMRLQRWCLQDLAVELTVNRGYDVVIDFASGLPTNDHLHDVVKPGTTVIYSDSDPVTVEYARSILAGKPEVYYFEGDARYPEKFLNKPEVQQALNGRRNPAMVYWGVSGFLPDADIAHAARYLYDWSDAKSCLAFNLQGAGMDPNNPVVAGALKLYAQMGSQLYPRSVEKYLELLSPWQPTGKGFISLLEWHKVPEGEMSEDDKRIFTASGGGFGAYLLKSD